MGGSRLVGHYAQEDARFRRRPPETAVAEALVCAKVFFFRVLRARAQWEVRDWSDITRKKTQGFGAAPPKRPSQKPLSARKSFFFAFCARARNGRFETGRTLRARRRKVSAPPPRNGRRRSPCLRESLFFSRSASARAQWEVRDWSDITRKKTQGFGAPPPETAVAEALVCAKVFFFSRFARARARAQWEVRDWSDITRKKTQGFGAAPPKRPSQKPLSARKFFFFRVLRARARNGRFETGRTLRARRRKVSAPPPRNGRRRSPCLRESLFFFAFCARARNGRFETGRTLRARRRKVSAPPPRNGRRRSPCLRESLIFSRSVRARAQWEVRDWSDITRKKTQGFGAPPLKRPSQKPLSARKSFFSGGSARAKPRNCKIVAELSVSDRGYLVVQLACRLISLHKTPEKSPAFYF